MKNVERDMASDRRSAPRRSGRPFAVEIEGGSQWTGEVIDRSTGGLALAVIGPGMIGTRLRVRPAGTPDEPWAMVEVRHGRPGAGVWLLGCRYVADPPGTVAVLKQACSVIQLPVLMPAWFRRFAVARLSNLAPVFAPAVAELSDADLRHLYAAVR